MSVSLETVNTSNQHSNNTNQVAIPTLTQLERQFTKINPSYCQENSLVIFF